MQELEQETILGDLSGFEFEDLMIEVFKKLGFENVRNPGFTGDEGRDIIMEKMKNGEKTVYIVECKNVSSKIGRPVVQKLHSAVNTFDTEFKKKGMIVTTSRFTSQAKKYVEKIQNDNVKLWDGNKLREIADEIGLDLYNGEIEILCEESLPLPEDRDFLEQRVIRDFENVNNFDKNLIENIEISLNLYPTLYVCYNVKSSLKTSVGLINTINNSSTSVLRADNVVGKNRSDEEITELVESSERKESLEKQDLVEEADSLEKIRFEKTETGFKKELKQKIITETTEEVVYTGKNNVTYTKTHEPKMKEISFSEMSPMYVPEVNVKTKIKNNSHRYKAYITKEKEIVKENEIKKDSHTGKPPWVCSLTLCGYCGSLNNKRNIKTEKIEEQPICKHCATTKRFALNKKYFKNQDNLEKFSREYKDKKLRYKLLENKTGLATLGVITTVSIMLSLGLL